MRLTVQDIFNQCLHEKGKIVAGHAGLSRVVSKITIAELPDAPEWLYEGDLVCTTGYALVGNRKLQENWISEMGKKGVAGLIIKPDRFLGSVPQTMMALADEYSLPLITMPIEVTWPTVIEGVTDVIIATQRENLRFYHKVNNDLTAMVLSSKSVKEIVARIGSLSGCQTILEDRYLNILAASFDIGETNEASVKTRLSPELRQELRSCGQIEATARGMMEIPIDTGDYCRGYTQLMAPVTAGEHLFGWLSMIITGDESRSFIRTLMNIGIVVLALSLLNENMIFLSKSKNEAHYIQRLAGEIASSDEDLRKESSILGVDLNVNTVIISMQFSEDPSSYIFNRIALINKPSHELSVFFPDNCRMIAFLHSHKKTPSRLEADAVEVAEYIGSLWEQAGVKWFTGISRTHCGLEGIRIAYKESLLCMKKAAREGITIINYDALKLESFFALVPDNSRLQQFSENQLAPLIEYDRLHHTQLLHSLEAYLISSGKKALAAKQLYIHVNTLGYRLKQIEDLLSIDLEDPNTRVLLQIAIEINKSGL